MSSPSGDASNDTPVTIDVLIADDQALVREGFQMMLDSTADIHVVGEAFDGRHAVILAHAVTGIGSSSTSTTASTPAGTSKASNDETVVAGAKAATLRGAALKQVPGGTVERVSTDTDSTGSAYEVHVTKADGSEVTVLFDANLKYLSTDTGHGGHGGRGGGGGGGNGETAVTGTKADTLEAAALAKVPGATVDEITTDSGDAAYEVHLTKTNGSDVTIKFDKNLNYVSTETGRGK